MQVTRGRCDPTALMRYCTCAAQPLVKNANALHAEFLDQGGIEVVV